MHRDWHRYRNRYRIACMHSMARYWQPSIPNPISIPIHTHSMGISGIGQQSCPTLDGDGGNPAVNRLSDGDALLPVP
jgi:hypothetical protein